MNATFLFFNFVGLQLFAIPSVLVAGVLITILFFVETPHLATGRPTENNPQVAPVAPVYSDPIMQQIENEMEDNHLYLQQNLTLDDVAKQLSSNRTYISNAINTETNMNFSEYVNSFRVKYAQTLMEYFDPKAKVCEVWKDAGFSSEASFLRNFKKIVGVTPKEWKANLNS